MPCQRSIANQRDSRTTHPEARGTSSALLLPSSLLLAPPNVRPPTSASDSASIHHDPTQTVLRQGMPFQDALAIHRCCVQLEGHSAATLPSVLPSAHTDVGHTPARAVRRETCRDRAAERLLCAPTRLATRSIHDVCRAIMQTHPVQSAATPHYVARRTPHHRNQQAQCRLLAAHL